MPERESAIVIPVPGAEAYVGKLREKYDPSSLHGVPAHITVLYPFRNPGTITEEEISTIRSFFGNVKEFEFSAVEIGTWPTVVYLRPDQRELFVELTKGVQQIFPDCLPYGGKFPNIFPHLTICQLQEGQNLEVVKADIEGELQNNLPIKTVANEAWLMESEDQGDWHVRAKFKFSS